MGKKPKRVIVLLGCMDKKQIMEKRWNASFSAIDDDTVFIVSGLSDECEYYRRDVIGDDYGNRVLYDNKASDTLSNAEGVKRLIQENKLEDCVLFCRLSRCHTWRFKKCLKMVGLKNKLDVRSSKEIPEAHNEWMAVLIYLLGPIGIRISNKVTKKRVVSGGIILKPINCGIKCQSYHYGKIGF